MTVIDGASNTTTTVSAGIGPNALAVNPVTNKIYVANYGSNNVTVINGAKNTTATVSCWKRSLRGCGEPGDQPDLRRQRQAATT